MRDSELRFDRSCHVLYSRPCRKQIQAKIALHYPAAQREAVWERVQRQYADFLSDWRTDLGGRKNFHNGAGGTYDCIALMSYYAVCRDVTSFREIEELEENLILPAFRKLSGLVDCNKPFFRRLMHKAFLRAQKGCEQWHDYEMEVAPFDADMVLKLGIASVALTGSVLLIGGSIDILTLFLFLLVASRLYDPMQGALQNLAAVIAMRTNVGRMNEILEYPVQTGSETLTNQGCDIVFDHVGFAYNSGETVLRDVSFTAKQGEVTALVGPSGGGKTTVSRLIRNKTVLIIAHRMRTVSGADQIVVLKDGAVAEQGSPAELLQKEGLFAHMVRLQTESQQWTLGKA